MKASKSARYESDCRAACRCTYFSLSLCTRYACRWGSVPERGPRDRSERDGGGGGESGNEIEVGSEGEVRSLERKGEKDGAREG